MNFLLWTILALSSGMAASQKDKSITIKPCAEKDEQYRGGSSQIYTVENEEGDEQEILKFVINITDMNIPANEKLSISTLKCGPNDPFLVAVYGAAVSPPVTITMTERNFTFSSPSPSVTASFHVNHECLTECNTRSCEPDKGTPIKEKPSWRCICNPGYQNLVGDNQTCVDVNECISGNTSSCLPNTGSCVNLAGTWKCSCIDGYANPVGGSSQVCEDVNECASGNVSSCGTENANCVNLPGTYRCDCGDRYTNPPDNIKACVEILCGRNFTATEGTIDYPQFGEKYPDSDRCAIQVTTTQGKKLKVVFTKFDIQYHSVCIFDYLEIFEDSTNGSPRLGLFCGNKAPLGGELVTSSNYIRFYFKSNNFFSRRGFAVNWTTVDDYCFGQDTTMCTNHTGRCVNGETPGAWVCDCNAGYHNPVGDAHVCVEQICGDFTTIEEGVLDYPGKDGVPDSTGLQMNYKPNQNCIWHFSTTPGKRLRLYFTRFWLEYPVPSYFDYLELLDGVTDDTQSLGKFSGGEAPGGGRFTTNNNAVRLAFRSDSTESYTGFRVVWNTVEPDGLCGDFEAEEGQLEFPQGGHLYENNDYCTWHISTTPGKILRLNFTRFDFDYYSYGSSMLVCSDYLDISSPVNATSPSTYCKDPPGVDTSYRRSVQIKFKSNGDTQKTGFKLRWTSV